MEFTRTLTSTASSSAGICIVFRIDPSDQIDEESESNNTADIAYIPFY